MKRTALITGSSRGIGQAIAISLAQAGYDLIIHGQQSSSFLDATLKALRQFPTKVSTITFDVSNEKAVNQACRQILKQVSEINILINNAGISIDKPFLKMSSQNWDQVIQINLYGTYYVTKALLPQMMARRFGRVINLSSLAAQRGAYGKTNYAAAKAGIIGFTKSLALEVASFGVTVNAVCPAWVNTGLGLKIPEKYRQASLQNISLRRMAEPKEIADLVTFLASDQSTYINGAVLDINGGMA